MSDSWYSFTQKVAPGANVIAVIGYLLASNRFFTFPSATLKDTNEPLVPVASNMPCSEEKASDLTPLRRRPDNAYKVCFPRTVINHLLTLVQRPKHAI